MTIEYRVNGPLTLEQLADDVFERSGIARPVRNMERLRKMTAHGNLTATAWDSEAGALGRGSPLAPNNGGV